MCITDRMPRMSRRSDPISSGMMVETDQPSGPSVQDTTMGDAMNEKSVS